MTKSKKPTVTLPAENETKKKSKLKVYKMDVFIVSVALYIAYHGVKGFLS